MATHSEYITALRAFIKDHDVLNRILKFTEENTDDELSLYINMSINFLNAIPPLIAPFTIINFPMTSLIIHQAAIECLISNGIVNSRNDITYNNGGVTVKIPDGDKYLRQLQMLYRLADMEISTFKQLKIAYNIEGAYGGVHSPYAQLHGGMSSLQPNSILSS